nr:hypothetical protein Itr_chr12CG20540 [Ipomoea trifida]
MEIEKRGVRQCALQCNAEAREKGRHRWAWPSPGPRRPLAPRARGREVASGHAATWRQVEVRVRAQCPRSVVHCLGWRLVVHYHRVVSCPVVCPCYTMRSSRMSRTRGWWRLAEVVEAVERQDNMGSASG